MRSSGNEGTNFNSLNTQATSKNSLVIGASQNQFESFIEDVSTLSNFIRFSISLSVYLHLRDSLEAYRFRDWDDAWSYVREAVCPLNSEFCSNNYTLCCELPGMS